MADFEEPKGIFDEQKDTEQPSFSQTEEQAQEATVQDKVSLTEEKPQKKDLFNKVIEKYKGLDKKKQIIFLSLAILIVCLLVTGITLAAIYGGRGTTDPPVVLTLNVSFDPGEDISMEPLTLTEEYTLPNLTKEGFIFGGWFSTSDFSGTPITTLIPSENANITIYAKWIPLLPEYDMSEASWDYVSAFTYDGSPKTVTVTGLPEGVTVAEYSNGSATDAGTYIASVAFNYDTENYMPPSIAELTWVINKAPGTIEISEVTTEFFYSGNPQSITGVTGSGDVSYSGNSFTNAGSYTVTVNIAESLNHLATQDQIEVTVRKGTYDMNQAQWNYSNPFIHDGGIKSVTLSGLPSGVTIDMYFDNTHSEEGEYSATATFIYDSQNYEAPLLAPLSWIIYKAGTAGLLYSYVTEIDGYEVEAGSVTEGQVVIPLVYDGLEGIKPVRRIKEEGFYDIDGITSVIIPASIREIKKFAFMNCSLLNEIILNEGLTTILDHAFYECSSLVSINFPNSLVSIGVCAFEKCNLLNQVIFNEGLTTIFNYAFRECSALASINLPDSLVSLGMGAFLNATSLTTVNIDEENSQLLDVEQAVFQGTPWLNNQDPGLVYLAKVLLAFKNQSTFEEGTEVTIEEGTRSIADYAFNSVTKISKITLPSGLEKIGKSAFYGMTNLGEINLPDTVYFIGASAFYNNTTLETIVIPSLVTSIIANTFYGCENLVSATLPEGLTSIETWAFNNCFDLSELVLPSTLKTVGNGAFLNCFSLTSIAFPAGIETIGNAALYGCKSLENIYIPAENEVYMTEDGVLYNKDKTTLIAYSAKKTNTSFSVPEGVTQIGSYSFMYATNLTEVIFPETLQYIHTDAFSYSSGITEVILPSSLLQLGQRAFSNCTSLSVIYVNRVNSVYAYGTSAGENFLQNTSASLVIYVQDVDSQTYYSQASNWSVYQAVIQVVPA